MRIYSKDIFLSITLDYVNTIDLNGIHAFTKSGNPVDLDYAAAGSKLNLTMSLSIPEVAYLSLGNINGGVATITRIAIDNITINQYKLLSVCKFYRNPQNIPVDASNINQLRISSEINLKSNGILVFDLFAKDSISYLMFIGNKIEF
jgi:hypothetical protein